MAQRRMFSKEITTSDTFVDMPMSSQLLYFHLGMEADDEGFIGNAKMLSRAYGANSDDLSLLKAKGFIIMFETGVSVVKDWNLNNKIRKDRVKPTIYRSEKSLLNVDIDGAYYVDNQIATKRQPIDNQMSAQVRLGKVRLGKDIDDTPKPPKGAVTNDEFESIWKLYPKKSGKTNAIKDFNKALKAGVSPELIKTKLEEYLKQIKIKGTPKRYIKNGSTWFHQKGWEDEYDFTPDVQRSYGNKKQIIEPQLASVTEPVDEPERELPEWLTDAAKDL